MTELEIQRLGLRYDAAWMFARMKRETSMDPFRLRDDDCWECIAEELSIGGDSDLAQKLREAVSDPLRNIPRSQLEMLAVAYGVQIEMAASGCRAQLRCKW
jgi:hypothetical protein